MKKGLILLLTAIIGISNVNVMAASTRKSSEIYMSEEINTSSINLPSLLSSGFKSLLQFMQSNSTFLDIKSSPEVIAYDDFWQIKHENVHFNYGGIQSKVRKELKMYSKDTLRAYVLKGHLFSVGKKVIISYYNSNLGEIKEGVVGTGETVSYTATFSSLNALTRYIYFQSSDSLNWIPVILYIPDQTSPNWNGYVINTIKPIISIENLYQKNPSIIFDNNKIYTENPNLINGITVEKMKPLASENKRFTIQQLYESFLDPNTGIVTNQSTIQKPNNYFEISDSISNISYDELNDITSFFFESNSTFNHEIKFSGKYPMYKIGDNMNLKFKAESLFEKEGIEFIDLDYNLFVDTNNTFPKLDKYIDVDVP